MCGQRLAAYSPRSRFQQRIAPDGKADTFANQIESYLTSVAALRRVGSDATANRPFRHSGMAQAHREEFRGPWGAIKSEAQLREDLRAGIIEAARACAVRTVNSVMTAAYWLIGRRIVEDEQGGKARAEYGEMLLQRLAQDLTAQFGRGFSYPNLNKFRQFYLTYPQERILSTPPRESGAPILSTVSRELAATPVPTLSAESVAQLSARFPLPWSAYVRLLSVKNERAREFYETEALRGGWSVRQLDRQINSQFPNKVMAAEYRTVLPDEDTLAAEIERTREILEQREIAAPPSPRKRGGKRAAMKRRPRSQAKKGKQK